MSVEQGLKIREAVPRRPRRPAWLLMTSRELFELWVGGRALNLIFIYSILLALTGFVTANNEELNLISAKELVFLALGPAISIGLFVGLITGADSISGERERSTLEALMLTPVGRRQMVLGKFIAALSPWPLALALTYPYLSLFSQGRGAWIPALAWGAFIGTILTIGFTGIGMLVSIWSNDNKTSLFVSLVIYVAFFLPTQFAGAVQTGVTGRLLKRINPMESANHFLEKVLVNNRTLAEMWHWLVAPVVLAVGAIVILFLVAAPRIRVDTRFGEQGS